MKWSKEFLYVSRNDQGVIIGVQEFKPNIGESEKENACNVPSRLSKEERKKASKEIEDQIKEYARIKKEKTKGVR